MHENRNSSKCPLVSIVIACYNDADYIEQAVLSALNQTYLNKEIIIVDDGSNLKTKAVLEKLKPRINLLITQKNQGQSIARNNAIKHAGGEYILNLDSDDFFEPTFCEKAINKFLKDREITIITCLTKRFNKNGLIDIYTPRGGDINNFLFSNSALGSVMFKKEDWENCGGYEEKLPLLGFEDWEFYIQILKRGGYTYVLEEILFNYRIRENSTTDRIRNLKSEKFKLIIYKHKDLYKENFEQLVENLFERIEKEKVKNSKNSRSIEIQIGKRILMPFRWIKSKTR